MEQERKAYASDVGNEEWELCAPYLTLMDERGPQRVYPLREIFNALRYLVKMGGVWRMMPHDLPPWPHTIGWPSLASCSISSFQKSKCRL